MAHWIVVEEREETLRPIARFEGTREEARRRLYEAACTHRFAGGLKQQRREVYRVDDDTYFVEIKGGLGTHRLRYCLAEHVWSTDDQ
ncbi:hypothetical protein OHB56_30700 [Streptomyces sp. NBC_01635]|uniref:hypothetical protein n=1 Tax=Streptomyces sp. NBC_01635 TaxID=2975904 RepID=UPI0038657485|nr:hypothetical protein OHB56_30700 [Streptomyces sp. NBC_01635]